MNRSMRGVAGVALFLMLLPACSQLPQSPGDTQARAQTQIRAYSDIASFEAAVSRLSQIDFESLPVDGSSQCDPGHASCTPIANPLVLADVSFADPAILRSGFCASPTCSSDPQSLSPGNTVLTLNPGATIDFPAHTGGALLVIEGIGDNPFQIRATDSAGNTAIIDGVGVLFGTAYAGFGSPSGIARIEVLSVGGTGGPLVVSRMIFSRRLPA